MPIGRYDPTSTGAGTRQPFKRRKSRTASFVRLRLTGGKFANGAITGAFSQAFNNEQAEVKFKERLQEAYRQAKVSADAVKAEVQARIDASDVEPVPLSQQELDAIRLYEALKIQKNESYRNLNDLEFYLKARDADGWFFYEKRASVLFELEGSSTALFGSDINYYNVGFAAASTGRGTAGMARAVVIWNLGQIVFRGANPAHNLRQIPIGIDWMKEGHSFYMENRVR